MARSDALEYALLVLILAIDGLLLGIRHELDLRGVRAVQQKLRFVPHQSHESLQEFLEFQRHSLPLPQHHHHIRQCY